jgi:acetolactate synthase-1/2/3 large subunit
MADGFWRASGRMACVNLVPGAGFTHALSGIAEAWMDGVPMLVLGCGIRRDVSMAFQLHDIDQLAMAAPVTKATFRPLTGAELYPMVRQACALARAGTPGPVMVEVPVNLYLERHPIDPTALTAPQAQRDPEGFSEDLARAAEFVQATRSRPLLYVGLGAASAGADLVQLAQTLGAPVATTIQGKGVFPESHPLFLWNGFGNTAPPFVRKIAEDCDRVLAIGCRFGEVGTGAYGLTLPGPLCHVDINPEVLNRNFPAELGIVSDAGRFVRALLGAISGHSAIVGGQIVPAGPQVQPVPPELSGAIAAGHAEVRKEWAANRSKERVSPSLLLERLQQVFGPETIYTVDSGNGMFLAMEHLRLDRPGRFLGPVDYSCMGYSVPAAIGARLGRPDAPVVALAGDGAFLMTGLECLTAASHGIPIGVIVLRDGELAQISQFQGTAFNRPVASELPDYDLAALARGMGIECLSLPRDADIDSVLQGMKARMDQGRPVIVEAAVDYSEKTYFTRGVVKTMLGRLGWKDRVRFVSRALVRKVTG